jgi:hypothetical protein
MIFLKQESAREYIRRVAEVVFDSPEWSDGEVKVENIYSRTWLLHAGTGVVDITDAVRNFLGLIIINVPKLRVHIKDLEKMHYDRYITQVAFNDVLNPEGYFAQIELWYSDKFALISGQGLYLVRYSADIHTIKYKIAQYLVQKSNAGWIDLTGYINEFESRVDFKFRINNTDIPVT